MRIQAILCGVILLGLVPNNAVSGTTGNELYEICTSRDLSDQISCYYYINGVVDTIAFLSSLPTLSEQIGQFCVPDGANMKQLVDATIDYLRGNPATRHGRAEIHVMAAIVQTWPCPK